MSRHTPGPWSMETVKTQVGSCHKIGPLGKWRDGREMYACVYVDGYLWPNDLARTEQGRVSIANARLMTAAPELLGVVKQFEALVRRLEGTEIEYGLAVAFDEVLINAHEVMAKALGVEGLMDEIDRQAQSSQRGVK